jgi:hypothetical protein
MSGSTGDRLTGLLDQWDRVPSGGCRTETLALSAVGNPESSRSTTMPRYLWHFDPDG